MKIAFFITLNENLLHSFASARVCAYVFENQGYCIALLRLTPPPIKKEEEDEASVRIPSL